MQIINLILNYWYLWILIILCFLLPSFIPMIKGKIGEKMISNTLSSFSKEKYILINDIMLLNKKNNKTAQIDHILVSIYGIFVIETKNYKGLIFGEENDEYWLQNIFGNKNQFRNPIKQNYSHVLAIMDLLTEYELVIYPIVTFSNNCQLKINAASLVVYFSKLKKTIKKEKKKVYTSEEILSIEQIIKSANINNMANRHAHIKNIHKQIKSNCSKECPRCGGELVKRHGKYGEFIGCTNFPKCRYTA